MTTATSVLMEDSKQKGDFSIPSKNVGSFVKINSISIDLADVNAKSSDGTCDHFSIRGYVSEVRRKNWKLCWPFDLDEEQSKLKDQTSLLPPLTSPKFRYWSCKCCVEKFGCTGTEKDQNPKGIQESKSKSDCCHIPSPCSTTMPLTSARGALKMNLVEELKKSACTSADMDSKLIPQDNNALVVSKVHTSTGTANGSANGVDNELPGGTSVPKVINLNVMQEKPECHTESRKLEEIRPVDLFEHSREHTVADVARETSTMSCVAENPTFVVEQLDKLKIASRSSPLVGSSDGAAKKAKKNTNVPVAGLLDDHDNASSDSSEIVGTRSVQGHKFSTPIAPQRRRARKIRLLTELLLESEDASKITEKASKDIPPMSVVNGESTGAGVISVLQGQKSFPDNDSNDNKKRKIPRGDELKFPEINLNKKLKSFKESEGNDIGALPGPEIKGDASNRLYSQANKRAQWSKISSNKHPLSDKRRKRKNQSGVDVQSYLVPVGGNFPNQGLEKAVNSNKGNVQDGVSFRAVNEASASSRGLDKISLSTPRMEKNSSSSKSKGKMPQLDTVQSSQYHWNDSGSVKSSPIVRSEEMIQNRSLHVPFRQVEEASIDTGLKLSLGGSSAPGKCNRKYTPQDGDGISPMVWREGTPVDETMKKIVERNYVSESTIPPKAIAYPFYNKRAQGDSNGQFVTYAVPDQNEKQNSNSQMEGHRSLGKHLDTSGAINGPKSIKIIEHSAHSRIGGAIEIADRAPEKGSTDDFPMDIVELLARIQYEKGLPISENRKNMLQVANEGRKTTMAEYDRLYSAERLRIPEETSSKRPNPQPRNGRNELATARKSLKPTKQKLVEQFPYVNGDHLAQKKSSSAIQISGSAPTECSCAQNCQWNANMLGHGFLNSSVQRGACNTCPVGQRSMGEASQAWPPSAIPLERPTKYNLPPRNNITIASSSSGLQHKGDYMSREQEVKYQKHYGSNLEMPSQHVVSETFSQRNTEYPYVNKHNGVEHQQNLRGSLDLYSNETIPAMHLLSLVTAGLSSAGPSKDPIDCHGKNQLVVKSHDFFPVNPRASSSSFRQERSFQRGNDFMGQAPFASRGKEKVQRSSAAPPGQNRGRALSSGYASGGYLPSHATQKGFRGASSSMVPMLQSRTTADYPTELRLGSPHATGTFKPLKSRTEFMACSVNRNPADFSVPCAENEFMIRGEDLKVKKSRKRRGPAASNQQRPQKQVKRIAEKERA